MKLRKLDTILMGLAGLALAIGLVWTLVNLQLAPSAMVRINARTEVLRQLQQLRMEHASLRLALSVPENWPRPVRAIMPEKLASMRDLMSVTEISERAAGEPVGGWRLRRVDLRISEAPLDALPGILDEAAAGRPPWVLRGCDIAATPNRPGRGRVVLSLEALESVEH
ncbi:MAG: hypothetical protein LC725_00555 [Lentisphaerae bacterium]|nr:hypothetical protein [Lentisphaerota bacterium]